MELGSRFKPVLPLILVAGLSRFAWADAVAAQTATVEASKVPAWKRQLSGDDAKQVESLSKTINQLKRAGKFAEAVEPARKVLAICQKVCGPDHWQTADARRTIDDLQKIAALPEEGRQAMASVGALSDQEDAAYDGGRYADAIRLDRSLLEIRRRWLGEDHPDTAVSYNNLAGTLVDQGKLDEAEPLGRKALAIRLGALGASHPGTALGFETLAYCLSARDKPAEAESNLRKAITIWLGTQGEDHPNTARTYNNLVANLHAQGKYSEAARLGWKALEIARKAHGADHPTTAMCYNNLAAAIGALGRYSEAETLQRKALASSLKALGEAHPQTALAYHNLAQVLMRQGYYGEAERLFRTALAIKLKALGADHHASASSYSALAFSLDEQRKYSEAEALFRKALEIDVRELGEQHFDTADIYHSLALNLDAQQKYTEAEPLHRKTLTILLKIRGEGHPRTLTTLENLADNLNHQGRYAEAEPLCRKAASRSLQVLGEGDPDAPPIYDTLARILDHQGKLNEAVLAWTRAADLYERARLTRSPSGMERALGAGKSPLSPLAIALARQGQPRTAWMRWEQDLARGLLDDLSARQLRPLTDEERQREADLVGQLQRLDERITRLVAKTSRTQDEDRHLDELRNQQSNLRGQWVEFQNALDRHYQAYAGKPATLEEIQQALPAEAALVGWLDVTNHHWACVVRHEGDPVWVKIPGTGPDGAWIKEDDERAGRLRDALAGHQPAWRAAAEGLARQRLAPLMPHLRGMKHLIVLPSAALAGLPIETLISTGPNADVPPILISYAPSGTMLARLVAPRSHPPGPSRLLALGDPAFPRPTKSEPAPTPPGHGIAILAVAPHGTADLFGLKPGDVLLEYNGKALRTLKDLAVVPARDQASRVPITFWRDGEIRALEIAAGPLGIQSNPDRPAVQVVLAQRAAAEVLNPGTRGETLTALPGTRREVQAIAALFPKDQVTTLMGPEATESNLQQLAQTGALKGYRYIHLATHGQANPSVALSSAVFLAAEPDRAAASSGDPAAPGSAPDGQVTAEQIVRTWDLDADLVVLSACESGLGRYAGGEGYLGFAQALFVKGARSLVLSQWKVNDKVTALLMTRFYQNLLGRRAGLSRPLPRAAALDEAKRWLRDLTPEEIGGELAAQARGPVRPLADGSGAASPSSRTAGLRPYAHPYYWASFVLVGNPD
jgi:tetratricopeptide (TPR) repeat protein